MAQPDSIPLGAFVVHAIPGRTRLRVQVLRPQPAYFDQLAARLSAHARVLQVTVNAATGSVLIRHDGAIEAIVADVHDLLHITRRPDGEPRRRAARGLPGPVAISATGVGVVACVALAAWQLRRGRLLGTATENAWNAYNAWRNLRTPSVATALLGGSLIQLARGKVLSSAGSLLYYALNLARTRANGAGEKAG